MIVHNCSNNTRMLCIGDAYVSVPPLGFMTFPDSQDAEIADLRATDTVKRLEDMGVLVFGKKELKRLEPVSTPHPVPPSELTATPDDSRAVLDKATPKKKGTITI